MKYKYIYVTLLILLTYLNNYAQSNEKLIKPKYKRVSEAYGYLIGQEYSLKHIKEIFPQYELNVMKSQYAFNSTFGNAKERMKKYAIEYLGKNEFKEFEDNLIFEMQKILNKREFTEEIAVNYFKEVESRAKGNIPTIILETLLSFQFSDKPQDELIYGFSTIFKTKGHLKSKNTDWQIKVPKSWKAEEADRPNIIKKFISDYGSGNESIMLMVKELPFEKGYKISKEELDDFFSEKEIKNMVPELGKYISFTKMTFDNNIGGMLEFEQTKERLDYKLKIRMVQFMFIRGNKMYSLQGMVGSLKSNTDLSSEMKKYYPLYKLVANSIVVNDQYK